MAYFLSITGIIALALVWFLYRGRKVKADPSQSNVRYPGNPRAKIERAKKPRNLKTVGIWTIFVLLFVWVGFSFVSREESPGADEIPEEPVVPPPLITTLTQRIDPPPENIENPDIVEFLLENNPYAESVGELVQAEEVPELSPMLAGARDLSPVISRMEPLGRALNPEIPAPPLKAPQHQAEPETFTRPRLVAPPPVPKPQPKPPAPLTGRRYTIILGSFNREDNAIKLKVKLEAEGLPVEIKSVVSQNQAWYRVMSGVFEDQAAAEAYSRELKRKNLVERTYIWVI
ncbi:MAG: SPOR domain-containing protein [Deltaproteobacteria bacterium]|jgi:cell division septation protein DedD|nr:SPOR domain-containing protein [Deltaproteobacteria bacterium]